MTDYRAIGFDSNDGQTVFAGFDPRISSEQKDALHDMLESLSANEYTAANIEAVIKRFGAERGISVRTRIDLRQ